MSFFKNIIDKIKPSGDNENTADIKAAQAELRKKLPGLQAAIDKQNEQKAENDRLLQERREQLAADQAAKDAAAAEKAAQLQAELDAGEGQMSLGDELRTTRIEAIQEQLDLTGDKAEQEAAPAEGQTETTTAAPAPDAPTGAANGTLFVDEAQTIPSDLAAMHATLEAAKQTDEALKAATAADASFKWTPPADSESTKETAERLGGFVDSLRDEAAKPTEETRGVEFVDDETAQSHIEKLDQYRDAMPAAPTDETSNKNESQEPATAEADDALKALRDNGSAVRRQATTRNPLDMSATDE